MTANTKAHRVVDLALGDRLLGHIAVAYLAINARANVRRVIEFQVCGRLEPIHALPGNVFAACQIGSNFLDLRVVRGDHPVAGHTKIDARNSGIGALIHTDVAIGALQAIRQVHLVCERDRLDGLGARSKKFQNGVRHRAVRRSKNVGTRHWRLR